MGIGTDDREHFLRRLVVTLKKVPSIIWNDRYRVPSPAHDDVCDYPLARNLVTLAVSVACEVLVDFVATDAQQSYTVTLADFAVRPFV